MADRVALSVVVPVYNGAATVGPLVAALSTLEIEGGIEVVLVNDGSSDDSQPVCGEIARTARVPVTVVEHARNYGEHNAVMTGLRHARGEFIVTMDDDLQNPPSEVERLYAFTRAEGKDVVYTYFDKKQHAAWRNLGSWLANATADLVLEKPKGLYLSSFRCLKRFVADEILRYDGPFPYVDGLIFQVTDKVGALQVEHLPSALKKSTYTFARLIRLWLLILVNFSVMPLRVSTLLGIAMCGLGLVGIVAVVVEYWAFGIEARGWASLMFVALLFSGAQLMILGLVGEYLGRVYLTVNRRPQAVVRGVIGPTPRAAGAAGDSRTETA